MGSGTTLIIGFDSEFQRAADGVNDVICISFAILDPATGKSETNTLFVDDGRDRRRRPTLASTLAKVLVVARQAGVITRTPKKLLLAAHWSRADLPAFRDFSHLKRRFDSPRKTFATTTKPVVMTVRLPSGPKTVSVTLVDTRLLAPAEQQSLSALGAMLDLPKLDLPDGAITRMREFSIEEPQLFRAYAERDAEIAARYTHEVSRFLGDIGALGSGGRLPPTLGAAAVNLLRRVAKERGIDLGSVLGRRGRKIAPELSDHLTTFAECFHGGRNEAYWVGYTPRTTLYDFDLRGAYSTAMAHFREPAWGNAEVTCDPVALTRIEDGLGFARLRFCFPAGTRFPLLPVRAGQYGLVFPLEGEGWCTGFELAVALDHGASIEVQHGIFVPWRSDVRPFAEFTKVINELRSSNPKGSLMERLAKEMGNSVYGKIAQQVAGWRPSGGGRRVFDSRSGEMRDMPPSSVTCAPLAAAVTGLVRAMLAEILALMPNQHEVFSVTTDGLLTTCPLEELRFGQVSKVFAAARALVSDSAEIIEEKHRVGRALILKTRGVISTEPSDPGQPGRPVIARAGHRMDPRPDDPWDECQRWERLYRERDWELQRKQKEFVSLRKQHEQNLDLIDVERPVRVNLEFDMKRRLVNVRDVDGLLTARTLPWRTVEKFLSEREAFDLWRRSRRRVLKAAADHEAYSRWREAHSGKRAVGSKGDRPVLAVLFIRAWARGALGLPGGSYAALAAAMSATGFPTTVDAVKKARRRGVLPEHSLDHFSSADKVFLRWVLARWPGSEIERLVAPGSPAAYALAELRSEAGSVPVPPRLPGMSACGTSTRSADAAQPAPAESGGENKGMKDGATCAARSGPVQPDTRVNAITSAPEPLSSKVRRALVG